MLVSMENLIGAAYTKQAQAAGLTGEVRPSMGRVDARFADWRIGVASEWAQLWVDRNFALDYTFKSLEKILDGDPRRAVRAARVVLKDAAYTIFGHMIREIEATSEAVGAEVGGGELSARLRMWLEAEIKTLAERMGDVVEQVGRTLPPDHARTLVFEHGRWSRNTRWHSINANDPCGT